MKDEENWNVLNLFSNKYLSQEGQLKISQTVANHQHDKIEAAFPQSSMYQPTSPLDVIHSYLVE